MTLRPPLLLGPYRLEAKLGQGGMAQVFRARAFGASGFEKVVAIKTLLPELVGEPQYERMFLEEARLQALANHKNLVQVHDLGTFDGQVYARLDFVDGADLAQLRADTILSPALASFVAGELAEGLEALHAVTDETGRPLGLVHRDVSAANVLISRRGEVKLADFGIAKATLLRDITRSGVRKGTYAYMSPEQVSGRALSSASDQFSLGILVVELLTGARPFDGATPLETMDKVREAKPPELAGVPEALRGVLLRMLRAAPTERFPTLRAVFDALPARASAFELADWAAARLALINPPQGTT